MATKKITDLVEITTAASDDVLPIVDVSLDITNKITTTNLLKGKQDLLVSGTNLKTINSTSLLGSGNISIQANPSGGAGAIQFSDGSAFASDASNLFWDDTNNMLGIGTNAPTSKTNIVGVGSTSATTSLLVQNSAGSSALTIKDDLSSLFGGDVESSGVIKSTGTWVQAITFKFGSFGSQMKETGDGRFVFYNNAENNFNSFQLGGTTSSFPAIKRNGTAMDFRLADDSAFAPINAGVTTLRGSGSTGATTSFLVQNSSGNELLRVYDDGAVFLGQTNSIVNLVTGYNNTFIANRLSFYSSQTNIRGINDGGQGIIVSKNSGTADLYPSSIFAIDSTAQGFLPPRMTTTQKNAISSPAAGLVVYDSTTNKLCCYNGTSWNDLF